MGVYDIERFKAVVDQAEIHRMAQSGDVEERRKAIDELRNRFPNLSDKKQAWDDLIRLTQDEDGYTRASAYHSLVKLQYSRQQVRKIKRT